MSLYARHNAGSTASRPLTTTPHDSAATKAARREARESGEGESSTARDEAETPEEEAETDSDSDSTPPNDARSRSRISNPAYSSRTERSSSAPSRSFWPREGVRTSARLGTDSIGAEAGRPASALRAVGWGPAREMPARRRTPRPGPRPGIPEGESRREERVRGWAPPSEREGRRGGGARGASEAPPRAPRGRPQAAPDAAPLLRRVGARAPPPPRAEAGGSRPRQLVERDARRRGPIGSSPRTSPPCRSSARAARRRGDAAETARGRVRAEGTTAPGPRSLGARAGRARRPRARTSPGGCALPGSESSHEDQPPGARPRATSASRPPRTGGASRPARSTGAARGRA